MLNPAALVPRPPFTLLVMGGLVATLLLTAVLFLAPAAGVPLVDLPRLLGGVFTGSPAGAFRLGVVLFFVGGVLVMPALFGFVWTLLPGKGVGFGTALVKGPLWGLLLWALVGLLLPLVGALGRVEGVAAPGFFTLDAGLAAAAWLLLAHVLYGTALGLVAAMTQGAAPMDTLGWRGHDPGDLRLPLYQDPAREPSSSATLVYPHGAPPAR